MVFSSGLFNGSDKFMMYPCSTLATVHADSYINTNDCFTIWVFIEILNVLRGSGNNAPLIIFKFTVKTNGHPGKYQVAYTDICLQYS